MVISAVEAVGLRIVQLQCEVDVFEGVDGECCDRSGFYIESELPDEIPVPTPTIRNLRFEVRPDICGMFIEQLTLVYIPTAYGTVSETLAGVGEAGEGGTAPAQSLADIEAERQESIAFNTARIDRELEELRSQVERMKREMEAERQGM